eukprot:362294-Chlamydomonas_euryale.AAC.5
MGMCVASAATCARACAWQPAAGRAHGHLRPGVCMATRARACAWQPATGRAHGHLRPGLCMATSARACAWQPAPRHAHGHLRPGVCMATMTTFTRDNAWPPWGWACCKKHGDVQVRHGWLKRPLIKQQQLSHCFNRLTRVGARRWCTLYDTMYTLRAIRFCKVHRTLCCHHRWKWRLLCDDTALACSYRQQLCNSHKGWPAATDSSC